MAWEDVADAPYLSASQITMYQRCPKQYEYRYIKGMTRPPKMALVVGSSVHKSIELNYGKKHKTKKPELKDVVLDAYSQEFEKLKLDADKDEEQGRSKDRGYAMATAHYDLIAPTFQPLEAPELEFNVPIPGIKRKLYGFIDVIGEPVTKDKKKKRLIMDNKTAKRKYERLAVELSPQLTAYEFAHRVLYGKKSDGVGIDAMVEYTRKGEAITEVQRLVTTRDEMEIKRFVETAQAIDKGINAGVFPPVDDARVCSWCGFNDLCQKSAVKRAAAYNE